MAAEGRRGNRGGLNPSRRTAGSAPAPVALAGYTMDVSIRPEGRQVQHLTARIETKSARDVSIRPEGRQVQHLLGGDPVLLAAGSQSVPKDGRFSTAGPDHLYGRPPHVSIRPEGRQVQHRRGGLAREGRRGVSIRPEGRQVQHPSRRAAAALKARCLDPSRRTAGSAPLFVAAAEAAWQGLNPSRRTAGSAPCLNGRKPRAERVSIRPEGRQVQHHHETEIVTYREKSQSVPKDGRFSTEAERTISRAAERSQSVPKDGRFSTGRGVVGARRAGRSQSVPKDGRFSTARVSSTPGALESLNPSRRTAGSAPASHHQRGTHDPVSIRPEGRQVQHLHEGSASG